MSMELLKEALGFLEIKSPKKYDPVFSSEQMELLRNHLLLLHPNDRAALFDTAHACIHGEMPGEKIPAVFLWFFSHPTLLVFEDFIRDEKLCATFADYLTIKQSTKSKVGRRERLRSMHEQKEAFVSRYSHLITKGLFDEGKIAYFRSGRKKLSSWYELELFARPVPHPQSHQEVVRHTKKNMLGGVLQELATGFGFAEIFDFPTAQLDQLAQLDDFRSAAFALIDVRPVLEIPVTWKALSWLDEAIRVEVRHAINAGLWLRFKKNLVPRALGIHSVETAYTLDREVFQDLHMKHHGELANIIRSMRKIEHGLLPIGLKIHCASKHPPGKDFLLKGYFAAHNAGTCFNLPPVGSIESVERLLGKIAERAGLSYLNNPDFQIQVCTPGKLNPYHAAILGIAFYLGSDQIRRYKCGDFVTTHATGDRLVIYGAGVLDRRFEWWAKDINGKREVTTLPAENRTDVLSCQSLHDIANVNLIASLLVHVEHGGYWVDIGLRFIDDIKKILEDHELSELLDVQWVKPEKENEETDILFWGALQKMADYAFQDVLDITLARENGDQSRARRGILFEMHQLLSRYRAELFSRSLLERSAQ